MTTPAVPVPPADPGAPEPGGPALDEPTTPGSPAHEREAALSAEAAKRRRELREAQAEIERLKMAAATDTERAVAAARAEGAAPYQAKWRKAVLDNAALVALAEKGVTATQPALRSLDLDEVEVDEDGRFDRAAVTAAVEDLLARYPIFAGQSGPSAPPERIPTLTGDGQRRLTTESQVRPSGKVSDAETERLLRYGLGG
jgi:hypothetical protein